MIIRVATLNDLEAILYLFETTIRTTCSKDYTPEQIEAWTQSVQEKDRWRNKIAQQFFLLAEIEGTLAGMGSLEHDNYIDILYVHPEYLRMGVAKAILSKLQEKANKQGCSILSSDVSFTAEPFFSKQGFVIVKKNTFDLRGVAISNYHMKKEIHATEN